MPTAHELVMTMRKYGRSQVEGCHNLGCLRR